MEERSLLVSRLCLLPKPSDSAGQQPTTLCSLRNHLGQDVPTVRMRKLRLGSTVVPKFYAPWMAEEGVQMGLVVSRRDPKGGPLV